MRRIAKTAKAALTVRSSPAIKEAVQRLEFQAAVAAAIVATGVEFNPKG